MLLILFRFQISYEMLYHSPLCTSTVVLSYWNQCDVYNNNEKNLQIWYQFKFDIFFSQCHAMPYFKLKILIFLKRVTVQVSNLCSNLYLKQTCTVLIAISIIIKHLIMKIVGNN